MTYNSQYEPRPSASYSNKIAPMDEPVLKKITPMESDAQSYDGIVQSVGQTNKNFDDQE
jgi:hypothetical protein